MDHSKKEHTNHDHGDDHHSHHEHMVQDFKRKFWLTLPLAIIVVVLSPMVQRFFNFEIDFAGREFFVLIFASIVYLYGGRPFLKGLYDEVKARAPGMMTLVGVAISVAYFYSVAVFLGLPGEGLFWELVTLVSVMLLGHWIEMRSIMGASSALEELAKLMPDKATRINEKGEQEEVALSELKKKDKVLVRPGGKVPADGIIVDGATTIDESMITGESKPIEKKKGDEVVGGAVNNEGTLTVQVEKLGEETYLSQITELVKNAQESKSKTQNLADRAALWLTGIALGGGFITLFSWLMFTTEDFSFALERTIAVIVIACPHALGLAIPLVVSFSTSISAKSGILVRNRDAFESLRGINTVVFDKTGTLTEGKFAISDIVSLGELTGDQVLKYAASVESKSEHPIASAIAKESSSRLSVKDFNAIPGKGAEGEVDGKKVSVVSPGYLSEQNIGVADTEVDKNLKEGKTVVFVLLEGKPEGAIALDDVVRKQAKDAVALLRKLNIRTAMLTGDNKSVAERVAREIRIDEYFAEVLPSEKSDKIKSLQKRGEAVAMVGDGINDAPALAQADVGIAIGAGTDIAIESAGVVLVKNNPMDVAAAIQLAQKTYRKMVQNLWWATGYNVVALPVAAGVLAGIGIVLNPAVGAVFMSLSTVIVAFNATLLKLNN